MRALLLDDTTTAKIKKLVDFAEKNQLSHGDLKRIVKGVTPAPGNRPGFSVEIPIGFRIVFTIEEHKRNKVVRHLSISVDGGENMLPNQVAVETLIKEFGFKKPLKDCMVYLEQLEPTEHQAVNIIELV